MARPDAIFNMPVDASQSQLYADHEVFNLNPAGRRQMRKQRPVLPIPQMLTNWLEATDGNFICRKVNRVVTVLKGLSRWRSSESKVHGRRWRSNLIFRPAGAQSSFATQSQLS